MDEFDEFEKELATFDKDAEELNKKVKTYESEKEQPSDEMKTEEKKSESTASAKPADQPINTLNPSPTVTEESVYAALREVFDPELPVNIVDLGLVYQVKIIDGWVGVKMSLTSPGCGLADQIANDAREKVLHVPGVLDADVRIVWQPAWTMNFMTPEARKKLMIVK